MIRQFALWAGGSWLILGTLGLILVLRSPGGAPAEQFLLGVLPVSFWQSLLYLLLGALGLAGCGQFRSSLAFARLAALFGVTLTLLGMVPGAGDLPALLPLTHDVAGLHGLFAVVAAYFGWGEPSRSYIALL